MADKFCENCGASLRHGDKFCASCGKQLALLSPDAVAPGISCPKCGILSDQAGVVAERLQSIQAANKPTKIEEELEVSREVLIENLSQPSKPKVFSMVPWIILMFIPFINIISMFVAPLLKGLKVAVSLAALVFVGFVIWAVVPQHEDPIFAKNVTMTAGIILILLYLVCLVISWIVTKIRQPSKLRDHEAILARWSHLYYCDKCAIVFFDDSPGAIAPVSNARDLLQKSTWQNGPRYQNGR